MNSRRFVALTLAGGACVLALGAAAWCAGVRVNGTDSLPPGVWQVYGDAGTARRGAIVNFCPPDTPLLREARDRNYLHGGTCAGDYETLFKPVVAVAGDAVMLTAQGIAVNGRWLDNSAPIERDGAGQALPHLPFGAYTVAEGTVWVVSGYSPLSFDSRYFGPITTRSILGQARPLWTRGRAMSRSSSLDAVGGRHD